MSKARQAFTLVEIMIVVAIIALLAAITIPSLLRAKISSNEALAKTTLRAMSTASESYANYNLGTYPVDTTSLTGSNPAYLKTDYCGRTISGYIYTCTFTSSGYSLGADPVALGTSGTTSYLITTGGVLTP